MNPTLSCLFARALEGRFARLLALLVIPLVAGSSIHVQAQGFDTLVMPGKLSEAHAKYEKDCKQCHTSFNKSDQKRLCLDCHKPVAEDVNGKRGFHGLSPTAQEKECKSCHTEHKGREAKIAPLDAKTFNHAHTDFLLKNAHETIECTSCHLGKVKLRDAPSTCIACHRKDDKHKGGFGEKCENCHNDKTWKDIKFDHDKTRFALLGKHIDVKCEACHANNRYKDTPRACVSCHRKDDTHKGRYSEKCESCHRADDWKSQFNHAKQARYPLLGKHATVKCEACHINPLFTEKLPTRCISCHTKDDVHKGTLGEKCDSCHKESSWAKTDFDHNRDSKFPLFNKHKAATCGACHKNGLKEKLPLVCIECHRKDDNNSHKGKFGMACDTCHGDKGWAPSTFDHTKSTRYALRGAHVVVKCVACHTGTLYVKEGAKALAMDCLSCHKKDDAHKGQLGSQCETCHNEKKWPGIPYDHNKSKFQLTGSHARAQCKACHLTPAYKDASRICAKCHDKEDVHKRTLGGKCESCHATRSWKTWDFDHTRQSKYPLDGAHIKVTCAACHRIPAADFTAAMPLPARSCVGCHSADDAHSGGFGPLCERCHVTRDWRTLKSGVIRGSAKLPETK